MYPGMMSERPKEDVEARLKRLAGQIAGIQKMVEADRYCIDVITQIAAAKAALGKVQNLLLESHINTCVKAAFEEKSKKGRDEKIAELVRVFDKNCNC